VDRVRLAQAIRVRNGRIATHLKGCGTVPDRADAIMPYIDGKRCFINKEILGIGSAGWSRRPPSAGRSWPPETRTPT
jgi:hypothetical protein